MKFIKKYWYFTLITIFTIGLGVVTFLTSQQLTKTTPVAPNVPQVTPKASEPACTLTFNLATPTTTVTVTPVPKGCNDSCSVNADCTDGRVCSGGNCRNSSCTDQSDCTCETTTKNCNESCSVNADCSSGLVCTNGNCRNTSCTDQSDCTCEQAGNTPTPTVYITGCNGSCSVNNDCSGGLVCIENSCRNASCTEKTNCSCEIAAVPTPQTPVAGIGPSILGASVIGSAFLLILLGLAL